MVNDISMDISGPALPFLIQMIVARVICINKVQFLILLCMNIVKLEVNYFGNNSNHYYSLVINKPSYFNYYNMYLMYVYDLKY